MVIWIIGLSGSGKSFYAKKIKRKIKNSIIVDGDDVRKHLTKKLGYSIKDRKKNSLFITNLCLYLESIGFKVICPILSIFPEHQKRNRNIYEKYFQIYIQCNKTDIIYRNNKKIYSLKKNVVGNDIKFPKPYKSNITFKNNFDEGYKQNVKKVISLIKNAANKKIS